MTKAGKTNIPRRLFAAVRQAGSLRKFAKLQGINILYVSQLFREGIEPTDRTERGQEVRVKLYLPRRKRQPRDPRPEEWVGQKEVRKRIRRMVKQTKKALPKRP